MKVARISSRDQRGFTVIEVMVVLVIVGVLTGAMAYSFKVMPRMKLKESSRKFAAANRFVSTLARTAHLYHRLVLDLDAQSPELKVEALLPALRFPIWTLRYPMRIWKRNFFRRLAPI